MTRTLRASVLNFFPAMTDFLVSTQPSNFVLGTLAIPSSIYQLSNEG